MVFVLALFDHAPSIAGYSEGQVLLFFALMNFVDIITQLFWFRGLTDLQRLVRTGDFDLVLTKPMSPLFWSAFRYFDFFDFLTLPAAVGFLWFAFFRLETVVSFEQAALGSLLTISGLVLAFSVNLILASANFWSAELDNAWWLYRDLIYVARFPPEVFPEAVRVIFYILVPLLVIVSLPAKAFMGLLNPWMAVWSFFAAAGFLVLSVRIWNAALKRYTSASA